MINLSAIENANKIVEEQKRLEREAELLSQYKEAERKAEFKVGDIVRCFVACKDQAALITKVVHCFDIDESDGGGVYTLYEVMVSYGRAFKLITIKGHIEDDTEDYPVIVKRAKR